MPNQNRPTSLRMADGGTFMKGIKRIWSGEATASPPPPPTATPTVQRAITSYTANSALDQRMKAAGLRDGGDLRTGHGGAVPGQGKGDKIPAKYEPGEFVVSNAMLDEAPGLRGQLHDLRNGVLASQGKTPAEADAKALRGTGLRAMDGIDVLERPMSADEAARFRPADAAAHAQRVNPTVPTAPNNPLSHGDGRYGAPGYDAGSTRSQNGSTQGISPGTQGGSGASARPGMGAETRVPGGSGVPPLQQVGKAPLSERAGRATGGLLSKAAPLAVAAGAVDALGNYRINDPDVDSSAGGTLRALGSGDWRGAGRSLSKGALEAGMDIGGFAADTADILVPGQPFSKGYNGMLRGQFGDQLAIGRDDAAAPPAAASSRPAGSVAAPVQSGAFGAPDRPAESGIRRVNGGSSPLFTNMPDGGMLGNDKLMGRGQATAQNTAALDAMDARYRTEARASLREPEAPQANGGLYIGADTGGYGLLDKGYQRERSLRMEGAGDDLSAFRKEANEAPRRAAERNAETQRSLRTDATTRRGQDLELDGRTMTAQSTAATVRFNAAREQANKDRDFNASQRRDDQTMGDTARKGLAEEMKVFGPDGKLDEGASAASVAVAQQLFPGIDRLTPEARSKVMPDVKEMAAIFNKAKDQDKVGFDALKFWEPARPSLRSMPNAKGGTTEQVSGLGGWFTAGAENGDTLLNNNGKTLNLGQLNERQRELLKTAQTKGWGQ